ncbi:hypothetical protein ACIQ2D_10130 [Lysinibacillus sp. NPDC097287]|uniref:hypothetical protein n=1 Tax=Lysinibacillus sp. NPDC097287 TaxID=3364144 RepID=UPI003815654C
MLILSTFIMLMAIGLLINGILTLIYKNKEKVDKGFTFAYAKLSYRRKLIRTLWSLLIMIPVLLMLNLSVGLHSYEKQSIFLFLVFLFLIQLAYNYYKWKKNEDY